MPPHTYVAIVTLLALLTYFWMSLQVPAARRKCGIAAPAMTGDRGHQVAPVDGEQPERDQEQR